MSATPFGQSWPSSWTNDPNIVNAAPGTGLNTVNSATITNSGGAGAEVLDTEIAVEATYGTTASTPAIVYVCRNTPWGYESPATDAPYSFSLPAAASTTCKRVVVLRGDEFPDFQVVVSNPSGNSALSGVNLSYRQSQGLSG